MPMIYNKRRFCPMRHENGNCMPAGGFCTAVNDPICEALHNAFNHGKQSEIEENMLDAAKMTAKYAQENLDCLREICRSVSNTKNCMDVPCKPGDTVFFIWCKTSGKHEVRKGFALAVEYHFCNRPIITIRYDDRTTDSVKHYLGLKAFMSLAEAEEALAKMYADTLEE